MKKENSVLTEITNKDIKLLQTNPDEFWKGVTKIGTDAFDGCTSLKSTINDN